MERSGGRHRCRPPLVINLTLSVCSSTSRGESENYQMAYGMTRQQVSFAQ
jgi:hypothetical protein